LKDNGFIAQKVNQDLNLGEVVPISIAIKV